MKQILIITFAFLLFTTPLFAQVQESGVLYLWEISEEKIWKSFGDDETQQKYKGEIKDGKPDGTWEMYHENGQLRSRGFFKDAELDGSLEIYSEDGLLMVKDFYENGKRISE